MSKPGIALLKVGLSQSFDFRRKDKARNVSLLVPILLVFIFGCLLTAIYSFLFSFMLFEAGEKESLNLVLYAMAGMASMLGIVSGFTKVKGTLFGGNDYEMLAALPVSKKSIIFVKLFSLYLVQAFYTVIFVLPATLIVTLLGKQPLWLIDGIVLLVFSPILPLFIAGILGVITGFISDRFRFGNILSVLFYIVFLGAIMYSSFLLNSGNGTEEQDIRGMLQLLNIFSWINPSTRLLTLNLPGVTQLIFILANAALLIFMVLIFAKCYDYFHLLLTSTYTVTKYVEKNQKKRGQFKALFLLDLKRYFSSKMYLLNTITGGVMSVLVTVVMYASFKTVKDPAAMDIFKMLAPYLVLIAVWCVGLSVPSAVCINMEGKSMWQIKSLPISYKQYAWSKILLSYVVLAPLILISSIILTIFTGPNIVYILINFLLPQLYIFSMSLLGFLVNSYFYKLKWSNETEAVKNSSGALLSMLLDLAYTGILCILLIIPGVFGFYLIGAFLSLAFALGMAVLLAYIVQRISVSNITNIEC